MTGQLLPFALSTPSFRFRGLASHAGRASLGGDREVALACFVAARLGAASMPPFAVASADATSRAASARQWLASLSLPAAARTAAGSAINAVADGNSKSVALAIARLAEASAPHLDQLSLAELRELSRELLERAAPAP